MRFYYLTSRFYDPATGRFINADGYVQTGQGILDKNMFAYCLNNPVNFVGDTGSECYWIGNKTGTRYETVGNSNMITSELRWRTKGEGNKFNCTFVETAIDQQAAGKQNQKPNMKYTKDKKKGSENRQKKGEREKNVAHPNAEEHSRVAKRNGIRRLEAAGVLLLTSVVVIVLCADDASGVGVADDVAIAPVAAIWWDSLIKVFA